MKGMIGKFLMWIVIIGMVGTAMFYAYDSGLDKTTYERLTPPKQLDVDTGIQSFNELTTIEKINFVHSDELQKTDKIECLIIAEFCVKNARFEGACDNCEKYTQEFIDIKYN